MGNAHGRIKTYLRNYDNNMELALLMYEYLLTALSRRTLRSYQTCEKKQGYSLNFPDFQNLPQKHVRIIYICSWMLFDFGGTFFLEYQYHGGYQEKHHSPEKINPKLCTKRKSFVIISHSQYSCILNQKAKGNEFPSKSRQ